MIRAISWVLFLACAAIGGIGLMSMDNQDGSRGVSLTQNSVAADGQWSMVNGQLILDPGHGGEDGGAVSCTGKEEASYNLAIGLKTRDLLCFLGVSPKMTRETDDDLADENLGTIRARKNSDLHNRAKFVSETPNAVLVSIHQNFFAESKWHGAQVFHNSKPESIALAEALQKRIAQTVNPGNTRQPKESKVYIMREAPGTAVLIECGFLTNPAEESMLGNNDYQKKFALAIASGLVSSTNAS